MKKQENIIIALNRKSWAKPLLIIKVFSETQQGTYLGTDGEDMESHE